MNTPDLTPALLADLHATLDAVAEAARVATLRYFRTAELQSDDKGAAQGAIFDPVTAADREAEAAMRAVLAERRPQDGILGEEFGTSEGTSGLTWVLDPVDGTRGFLSGTPTWGVLAACCGSDGAPLLGCIDQPYLKERFTGGPNGATLVTPTAHQTLSTRRARALEEAILFSTFPEIGTPAERAAFTQVADRVRLTRYGMDCYGYALLALGQIDLVIEAGLFAYDICGPMAVVQAAGGIVTDWQGGPAQRGGQVIAAANADIHAAALARLAG